MSKYAAFRRQPIEQQFEQQLRTIVLPAPTRGIVRNENDAFMQPGGSLVQDNWAPTLRGCKLRGGCTLFCDLHALDYPAWANSTAYVIGNRRYDGINGSFWDCAVNHTSAAAGTSFAADRTAHPTYWTNAGAAVTRLPVISAFEYMSGSTQKMFAGQATKLFDVSAALPVLIKSGQTSGNYCAVQFANAAISPLGTNWMIVCNEAGDYPLRYNGSTFVTLDASGTPPPNAPDTASWITGPAGTQVQYGHNLSYVWKYRNRLFFIETSSMNAWYLAPNAVGGLLTQIPLAGSASLGGKLSWGATWSMDAGDGIQENCIFGTDQGEVLIFTGTNPADPANWAQKGRYFLSPPLGMNAHIQVGGDMLIACVDGIIPLSQAITKDAGQLDLAMLTRSIEILWHEEVAAKRSWSWTLKKWDDQSIIAVTTPGDAPGAQHCLTVHNTTGAWCRYLGWDATCFLRQRADMYFGTQTGVIMQGERTGFDTVLDPNTRAFRQVAYVATLVGGWEGFGAPANEIVWHQSRAAFRSAAGEPFQPQLAATTDYVITIPPPPPAGRDPGVQDVWDQAIWCPTTAAYTYPTGPPGPGAVPPTAVPPADMAAYGQWDQPAITIVPVRNTMWVSIGQTGFAHAPIVQVMVAQQAPPVVELLAVSAIYEPAGVNV